MRQSHAKRVDGAKIRGKVELDSTTNPHQDCIEDEFTVTKKQGSVCGPEGITSGYAVIHPESARGRLARGTTSFRHLNDPHQKMSFEATLFLTPT